jgi:hypothetical protein
MDTALHPGDRNITDHPDNELARVADGGRFWEMWNFCVRDFVCAAKFIGESTKTRAQDKRDFGAQSGFGKNEICGSFGAFELGIKGFALNCAWLRARVVVDFSFEFGFAATVEHNHDSSRPNHAMEPW